MHIICLNSVNRVNRRAGNTVSERVCLNYNITVILCLLIEVFNAVRGELGIKLKLVFFDAKNKIIIVRTVKTYFDA